MPKQALITSKTELPALVAARVRAYAEKSKADNTLLAYRGAWGRWGAWCAAAGRLARPARPEDVAAYLAELADSGKGISTITTARAAISAHHANMADPTQAELVVMTMGGIARQLGRKPAKKAPVTLAELRAMVAALPDTLPGKRDKAILLVGFAGAFRRSELAAVRVEDMRLNGELKITLPKSKTDQTGEGAVKVIPALAEVDVCPVRAMRAWLKASGIKSGPVFRKIDRWGNVTSAALAGQAVAFIVKAAAERAGLDGVQFSGHSLRSGFITEAASAGIESRDIMAQTGHKSEIVMRGYIQDAGLGAKRAVIAAFGRKPKGKTK